MMKVSMPLVVRTEERVPHHRLARTFRHGIPGVFQELQEALQQRTVPRMLGQAVQFI